jgi:hypothetical protein
MPWTVACLCEHLSDGSVGPCPRCGTPVPVGIVRPSPIANVSRH